MKSPDFERAKHYVLERLARDLPPGLYYHSLEHTRDDVVPATERLADLEGVTGEDRMLLLTAAFFHDVGHVEQSNGHEALSARIASEVLPRLGYSPEQIARIVGMIMATKLPQTPHNLLEEIMADADLDSLGRDDGLAVAQKLRAERAESGVLFTDEEWYAHQLAFLTTHRYFTQSARLLRDAGKQRNIERLARLLEESRSTNAPPDAG